MGRQALVVVNGVILGTLAVERKVWTRLRLLHVRADAAEAFLSVEG